MNIASIGLHGMQQAETRVNRSAERIARDGADAQDMVELSAAARSFETSTKLVATVDEMAKSTLDLLG